MDAKLDGSVWAFTVRVRNIRMELSDEAAAVQKAFEDAGMATKVEVREAADAVRVSYFPSRWPPPKADVIPPDPGIIRQMKAALADARSPRLDVDYAIG